MPDHELAGLIGKTVVFDAAGPVLEGSLLQAALGLGETTLRAALRSKAVFSIVERGEGEDAGRHRLTLRHRATEVVLVVDAAGLVISARRSAPAQRD